MKRRKVFALFLFTALLTVYSQAQDFSGKVFSGTINNRYPIRTMLNRKGATITGSYLYTKVGKSISLRGEMQSDGTALVFEVNDKGENTGVFRGAFENNRRFFGTWSEPDGSRRMPFEVELAASGNTSVEGYFFSFEQLKPHIRRDGLLAIFF